MDKPLPGWLIPWLNRPGWQWLVAQWVLLAGIMLLLCMLFVVDEWQQREQLHLQGLQLASQLAERQQQLAQLPTLAELEGRLQQHAQAGQRPDKEKDFATRLRQVGGVLLRWQQQGQPEQKTVKLQMNYHGLLRLLEEMPPTNRIGNMKVEKQPEGLTIQLNLLSEGERADE